MTDVNLSKRHVPTKEYYTLDDVANLLCTSKSRVRELSKRQVDPIPFVRLEGMRRGMFVASSDLKVWVRRNSIFVQSQLDAAVKRDDDA